MKFTDRFVHVPVELYDVAQAQTLGLGYNEQTKCAETEIHLLHMEVSHYRAAPGDGNKYNETLIHMKNGNVFQASLTVKEFEELLNNHQK